MVTSCYIDNYITPMSKTAISAQRVYYFYSEQKDPFSALASSELNQRRTSCHFALEQVQIANTPKCHPSTARWSRRDFQTRLFPGQALQRMCHLPVLSIYIPSTSKRKSGQSRGPKLQFSSGSDLICSRRTTALRGKAYIYATSSSSSQSTNNHGSLWPGGCRPPRPPFL